MNDLPYSIYMTLNTQWSLAKINALFTKQGWSSRMCSWTEHEITSAFAELVIASKSPVLISGSVDQNPDSINKITAVLDAAEIDYSFDVFDEDDSLLASRS